MENKTEACLRLLRKLRDAKARMIMIVYFWPKASLNITLLCNIELARQTGVTGLGFVTKFSIHLHELARKQFHI
jgi:hypothetical protein